MIGRESITYSWPECLIKEGLTNIRMYGSICSRCRNVSHPELGGLWGKVKIVVMKYLAVLQAQPSRQGQRIGLKVYM